MKPWLPYHAYTSLHRVFGGLHRLEFYRAQIAVLQQGRANADIHILCIGEIDAVLPLAALGYQLSVITEGPTAIRLQQDAEDAKVSCKIFSKKEDVKMCDIVLLGKGIPVEDAFPARYVLGHIQNKTFVIARDQLRAQGWQTTEMQVEQNFLTQVTQKLAEYFFPKHLEFFHVLDACGNWMASHAALHSGKQWMFVAKKASPEKALVMHIVPTLGAGGAERVVFDLAQALPQRGYEIETVSIIRGGEMESVFRQANLSVTILSKRGLAGISAILALRRLMHVMGPKIVHTHLFGADVWGSIAARLAGIRQIVSTEHSINKDYTSKHVILKRLVVPLFKQFIAVSTETEQYLHAVQYVPQGKVSIVRNGIDMRRVILRGEHSFATEPKLVIVARLIPSKGHRTLFQALSGLMHLPWRLQIIGNGPDEANLREEAERMGVLSRIEWLGYRTDVPELVSRADIFCFPSQWEGLGLSLIEAAAAGVPIISSDLPALREVLNDEQATFVLPYDIDGWREAIRQTLDRQEVAIRRASQAVPHIQERFSLDRMAVGYAAVYRRLFSI